MIEDILVAVLIIVAIAIGLLLAMMRLFDWREQLRQRRFDRAMKIVDDDN